MELGDDVGNADRSTKVRCASSLARFGEARVAPTLSPTPTPVGAQPKTPRAALKRRLPRRLSHLIHMLPLQFSLLNIRET